MTYRLTFAEKAAKEWNRLHPSIREQFRAVLVRRLEEPHVPSARLHGRPVRYKIKLKAVGYRLLYEVHDEEVTVVVIAVGRRDSIYDEV